MSDLALHIQRLRRPSLLVRAARHGLQDYSRARDLDRLLPLGRAPAPDAALAALVAEEERLETTRRAGDASYSFVRHIDVMIALLAEARLCA